MCKYCECSVDVRKYLIRDNDELELYIDGNGNISINDDYNVKINYCPMCGRKLSTQ